jgi:hypothetical protein
MVTQLDGPYKTIKLLVDAAKAKPGDIPFASAGVGSSTHLAAEFFADVAGVKMLQRRAYGLVMTGVILGMIPCLSGCCCIGLPFGIWALIVLSNPEVRNSFR